MPDKSIGLVLTDPPYGIGESSKKNASRGKLAVSRDYGDGLWDKKLDKAYIDEILRISKNQIIWGGNYYADWLPPSSCWLVWDKENGANDFADCELGYTSFPKAVRIFRWMWNGMIRKGGEERFHLTQKPLALMKWCISNYAKPGDVIYDPFMGSGTTMVAAKELGFDYRGCEIHTPYFDICRRRVNASRVPLL